MTDVLRLRPLRVEDAAAMVGVLADPALYEYTDGQPPTVQELTRLYELQTRGHSGDGSETWINMVVTLGPDERPIGYVQATVPTDGGATEIAWVIGVPWQGHGYATRAARLLITQLEEHGIRDLVAHIHPDHTASQHVATRLGLVPTAVQVDGEAEWRRSSDLVLRPAPQRPRSRHGASAKGPQLCLVGRAQITTVAPE